jgi:hypothetical protein
MGRVENNIGYVYVLSTKFLTSISVSVVWTCVSLLDQPQPLILRNRPFPTKTPSRAAEAYPHALDAFNLIPFSRSELKSEVKIIII